jgi:hypothetical protein
MNPEIVLSTLLTRLETKIGAVPGAKLRRLLPGGEGHLVKAVMIARDALLSGDSSKIASSALLCLALERTGYEVIRLREARNTAEQRRRGGQIRGMRQTQNASPHWAPFQDKYWAEIAAGRTSARAFAIVKRDMTKGQFGVLEGDAFPSDPTIRKWMKKAKPR